MGEIFDLKKEIADEGYWIKPEKILGNIEIKDLIFRYGTRKPVLNKISLNINAGESIGFVGASGSGKTSLIKLLLKFYSCGGFNTPTLCVVTKGIKADCNHLMRTTYPDALCRGC